MDRQSMLDKIYEKIADKTLSFWCKLIRHTNDWLTKKYYILWPWRSAKRWISSIPFWSMDLEFDENMISKSSWDWYEIIWHPVSLARVLSELWDRYRYQWWEILDWYDNCVCTRKLLTDSGEEAMLDDQSDETIRAILSLLSE
jgi:hypothetical protein